MKKAFFTLAFGLFLISSSWSQNFCLRLSDQGNDGTFVYIGIEIQGPQAFGLGTSNLVFTFDPVEVSNPTLQNEALSNDYLVGVTSPGSGKASFNIELLNFNNGQQISNWTYLGTVRFDLVGTGTSTSFDWSYNGGSTETVVFQENETQIFAESMNCLEGIPLVPLPVTGLTFEASKNGKVVELVWETLSELNNKGFYVQRSGDGQSWGDLQWIHGAGTSLTSNSYAYIDAQPFKGSNYYRLKQVDLDGQNSYSNIREVQFGDYGDISVFPNPTMGKIYLNSSTLDRTSYRLIDAGGQIHAVKKLNNRTLDLEAVPTGIYLLEASIGGKKTYLRIVKN